MNRRTSAILSLAMVLIGLTLGAAVAHRLIPGGSSLFGPRLGSTYTIERTDYTPPPPDDDLPLADDRLEDKAPTFDPDLVHPTPADGWRVNLSDAVIRLDVPIIRPDSEGHLLELHPSYAGATRAGKAKDPGAKVLPSVNLIDGKAKQFDDGLMAAVDLAGYRGVDGGRKGYLD